MAKLLLPSEKYTKSLISAWKEQCRVGEMTKEDLRNNLSLIENPKVFVKNIRDKRHGIGLKPEQVPVTRYWLIDKGVYIGTLGLRTKLTKKTKNYEGNIGYYIRPSQRKKGYGKEILRLGLLKAKDQGLNKVYLNCSDENKGSIKIIEANGGKLIERVKTEEGKPETLRFLVSIN